MREKIILKLEWKTVTENECVCVNSLEINIFLYYMCFNFFIIQASLDQYKNEPDLTSAI